MLAEALNVARCERGLSWPELTAEINRPFAGTDSIPISLSTLKGIASKQSVTSAVVLQVLGWLERGPECFLSPPDSAEKPHEVLPASGPGRILRFDTRAMYQALDAERVERGMTWKQVAAELPGFSASMLRNLATGPLIGFPRVMRITQWIGQPAASFVRVRSR
jgi:hypothetical protein